MQKDLKRLVAYSSVAHAGYTLIGVVALTQLGAASVVFYLAAYIATNLLAFGIIMALARVTGLAGVQLRLVDTGDRGGGNGLRVKAAEAGGQRGLSRIAACRSRSTNS